MDDHGGVLIKFRDAGHVYFGGTTPVLNERSFPIVEPNWRGANSSSKKRPAQQGCILNKCMNFSSLVNLEVMVQNTLYHELFGLKNLQIREVNLFLNLLSPKL